MPRWILRIGAAVVGAGLVIIGAAPSTPLNSGAAVPARSEADIRDLDIVFYQGRLARDPQGATDRAQLARLHLQRARETGAHADLLRAEELGRRSLELRQDRNGAAFTILASSLLAQHRFLEAIEVAARHVALDSGSVTARALLGEIQLELGRYDEAARNLGMLAMRRLDPVVAPRLARWEELRGRPAAARRLLREAREAVQSRHALPKEQLAWFHLRLGDLAMRHGRLDEARTELRAGLATSPQDYRLLGTMARLELLRGRPREAVAYAERVIGRVLDPTVLGVLHDAHVALGDSAGAEQFSRAVEVAVLSQPGPAHRGWSMLLLDHGRSIDAVLARAQDDVRQRRDVYGWDLLAWALHQANRNTEAHAAMTRALALGSQDAMMEFHAGRIMLAVGDSAGARRHLERALAINPFWHPVQPTMARALLDSL